MVPTLYMVTARSSICDHGDPWRTEQARGVGRATVLETIGRMQAVPCRCSGHSEKDKEMAGECRGQRVQIST
jgi:hypothetical protein